MLAEEIREYCLNKKGVTEGFPFDETTLVFKVGGKMFLLMALEKQPLVFSAKNTADYNEELREQYSQISGAYHMNKTHWNSVICEGLTVDLAQRVNARTIFPNARAVAQTGGAAVARAGDDFAQSITHADLLRQSCSFLTRLTEQRPCELGVVGLAL